MIVIHIQIYCVLILNTSLNHDIMYSLHHEIIGHMQYIITYFWKNSNHQTNNMFV